MQKFLVLAGLVLAATACSQSVRSLGPMRVASHADTIVRDGVATIPDENGDPVTVRADEVVTVRITDPHGLERPVRLTMRSLVEGCVGDVRDPACLAGSVVDKTVVRRTKTRLDADRIVAVVAVSAIGGLAGFCTVECENGASDVQRGAAISVGIAGAFLGSLLLAGLH